MKTNVLAWLIFIVLLSIFVLSIISERRYKTMMLNLPKEYTPVIGSLNKELREYAKRYEKIIPTADETFEIVKGQRVSSLAGTQPVKKSAASNNNAIASAEHNHHAECNYCRKCGAKLQADSAFCHKCGTKNTM